MGTWMRRHRTKYVFNHEVESMDHILEGVLASGHPERMKQSLIHKITQKGQDQHPASDVRIVLTLATNWVLEGTSQLQVSSGFQLLKSWGGHHAGALESFLTRELLVNLLSKPSRNQANLPLLLGEALAILQQHNQAKAFTALLKVLEAKAPSFLQASSSDIGAMKNFLQLLVDLKDSLPKACDLAPRLALPLVQALACVPMPSNQQAVNQFLLDVTFVVDFLQELLQQTSCVTIMLDCLKELFSIISAVSGPEPSVCLGALVKLIPTELIEKSMRSAVCDGRVSEGNLSAALRRMLDWLVWPCCRHLDQWVLGFLRQLAQAKNFSILIAVTQDKVDQVAEKMRFAPVREASFNILSHMLLSFQHSPQPFHKVLPMMPELLEVLGREEAGRPWRHKLATLLHYLMYLHTGFPDLYHPILDLIKDVPCPSSEEISCKLAESRWSGQQCHTETYAAAALTEKSQTGKTGLFNLGNTCYMNSILQTLFMCDQFRRQTLLRSPTPEECLLDKLQHVFAYLLHSQRPAVAPLKFLSASKPPWFVQGEQQDCSEFLKYLLDQLHEQQLQSGARDSASPAKTPLNKGSPLKAGKAADTAAQTSSQDAESPSSSSSPSPSPTLVTEAFGGKVRSTSRCLSCGNESQRVEDFLEIPLAFPDNGNNGGNSHSPNSPKSLVGGGAHLPQGDPASKDDDKGSDEASSSSSSSSSRSPGVLQLQELLGHFLSAERLEGDNQYHCDQCGTLQDGERTLSILQAPHYLILILLRFHFDAKRQARSKIFQEVRCPRTLAVPVQSDATGPPGNNSSTACKRRKKLLNHLQPRLPPWLRPQHEHCQLYGLCSVVVHSGASSECGHYYSYARHSRQGEVQDVIDSLEGSPGGQAHTDLDFLEDRWCLFNDMRVSRASYALINDVTRRFPKDTPYVLVYRKLALDGREAEAVADPPLSPLLREAVNKDQAQYLAEQELAAKKKDSRSRSSSISSATFNHWREDSDDKGPPGSCGGGGGLGGLNTSGSRFVF